MSGIEKGTSENGARNPMGYRPDWRRMLPKDGRIDVIPQVGRVAVPPKCIRQTLTLTGNRRLRGVRVYWVEDGVARLFTLVPGNGRMLRLMDGLTGGETLEFVGRPREWHGQDGETCYAVVVSDMDVIPTRRPAPRDATGA